MITVSIKKTVGEEWNSRLLKSELATINQTKEWGTIMQETGQTPLFLEFVNEQEIIIGQLLILVQSRFQKRKFS